MTKINIFIIVLLLCLLILSYDGIAYSMTPTDQVVHQYITKNATDVWPLIPYEIKTHTTNDITLNLNSELTPALKVFCQADYDSNDDIITGSGEEDTAASTCYQLYRNHYWDSDVPNDEPYYTGTYSQGLWMKESSFLKALSYWDEKVIPLYVKGDYDQSYYWLGRVAHLLEDAAQPGHVLLDPHGDFLPFYDDDSALEIFTADDNNYWSDTAGKMNVQHFEGSDYAGQQYDYENLIDGFDWGQVDSSIAKIKKNKEFFRLFWYTAQKTQYFASDTKEQDFTYEPVVGSTQNWDCSGTGNDNLWADEGYTSCSDFVNESQMQIDDPTNNGTYVSAEATAVIPHAMKAVAGLYRLFDDAVRIDWPTENHDYRRTGFTLLKGDMPNANAVEKTAFVLGTDITQEQVLKPIVADIDGNGYMETVNFVHDTSKTDRTDIYSVEIKNKKTVKKWKQTAMGGAVYFPGTLADLDGESGSRKELITGTRDGRVYAYNIGADGKTISQRWSSPGYYQLAAKWSPLLGENAVRFNGGNAVVDLDLDGKNEIIFADVFESDGGWNGEVYVLKDNGNNQQPSKWGNYTFGNGGAYATVSVANIDDDDNPEIIVPSMYGIYVFDYNSGVSGKLSLKWSNSDGRIQSSAIIADVDMDNEYEIVYTTHTGGCFAGKTCYNRVYVRDAATGNLERQINLNTLPRPTPTVANLDSDANLEIVVLTQDSYSSTPVYGDIYCYDAVTGNACSGSWPFNDYNKLKTAYMSPNVADIDNDGNNDIIFAENDGNRLFVLKNDGTELFHYQFEGFIDNGIAIADVDKDGVAEIALKRAGSPITLFSTMSSFNKPPELNQISNVTAIVGDLINVNEYGEVSAVDPNANDTPSFSYNAPFNSSGLWQTNVNDTGNYSILVEVSDGNLSDYRYVDVIVFNENTTLVNNLTDDSTEKTLDYSGSEDQTVQIRLPKNATVVYSKITLEGSAS